MSETTKTPNTPATTGGESARQPITLVKVEPTDVLGATGRRAHALRLYYRLPNATRRKSILVVAQDGQTDGDLLAGLAKFVSAGV